MPNIGTAEIRLTSHGVEQMLRTVRAIDARIDDVSPAWPPVIGEMQDVFAGAFGTEGGSTVDGPWSPLAERTQQERARSGFGAQHPILDRTGALRRSLTGEGGGYSIETSHQLLWITTVPYFAHHQHGTRRMPARKMVSLTDAQREQILRPIRLYLWGRDATARDAR